MTRRRALWILGIASLVLFAGLLYLDRLMQDAGGVGIVDFELAWTAERAGEIRAAWGEKGQDAAELSLWLDFPYLLAYGLLLWLGARALRDAALRRGWRGLARPGGAIAWIAVVGAACDVVEDALLLMVLRGDGGETAPALAAGFASVKFLCIGIAVLYVLGGLVALGVARVRRGDRSSDEAPA